MTKNTRAKFLMFVAVLFMVYSVLWGLAPFDNFNLPARLILDISDWPLDNYASPLDKNTQWLTAISAGLLAAISVFLGGIVVPAIREGNSRIIRTTLLAMTVWFIIDGVGSIASGVTSNVFFNLIYLVLVLIPLLWKDKTE